MNCNEYIDAISAYVDGEATLEERVALERHLETCSQCTQRLVSYRSLRHTISLLQGRTPLPEALNARTEVLRFRLRGRLWPSWVNWLSFAVAASAVVLVVLLVFRERVSTDAHSSLADELVADYVRYLPITMPAEVASQDPSVVSRFFADRIEFEPIVPTLTGARLIGGRVCTIEGRKSQLLFYQIDDRKLSLYVLNQPSDEVPECRDVGQHHVCGHRRNRLSLMLVGDVPDSKLEELLDTAAL